MMKEKITTIFDYFEEEANDPNQAAVLGNDFGDGELCVVKISLENHVGGQKAETGEAPKAEAKLRVSPLNLTNMAENVDYATLFLENGGKAEIGRQSIKKTKGKSYANYKKIPENADELYGGGQDGDISLTEEKSYRYLMGKAFGRLVENALNYGNITEKEIYLFVGRPSSRKWENQARQYRDILKSCLPEDRKFHVLVISEARAAMANEYRKNRSLSKKTVAIFDGGSSTFDCAVVKEGRVVCEYSRQVGAGMLDKNLLDIYMLGAEEVQKPEWTWKKREQNRKREFGGKDEHGKPLYSYSEGAVLCEIREQKEKYFGASGKECDPDARYYLARAIKEKEGTLEYYRKKEQQNAAIKDIIDTAIYKMPVRVVASYPYFENDKYGCGEDVEYRSFAAAVKSFFEGAKAKWEKMNAVPEEIIITGGATLMPFVEKLMNEVIRPEEAGIHVTRQEDGKINDRHFSVANGVAYMGYLELYKQKICREVMKEIKESGILSQDSPELGQCIINSYVNYRYECIVKRTAKWAQSNKYKTLTDWSNGYPLKLGHKEEETRDTVTAKYWKYSLMPVLETYMKKKGGCIDQINEKLKKKTEALFPHKEYQFARVKAAKLAEVGEYYPEMLFDAKLLVGNWFSRKWNGIKDDEQNLTDGQKNTILNRVKKNEEKFKDEIRKNLNLQKQEIINKICSFLEKNLEESIQQYAEGLTEYMIMEEYTIE